MGLEGTDLRMNLEKLSLECGSVGSKQAAHVGQLMSSLSLHATVNYPNIDNTDEEQAAKLMQQVVIIIFNELGVF